jgi:hypothetical protein
MNIEQTKEAIRIMQAFVDGKEVQRHGKKWNPKESLKPDWSDIDEPCWDFDNCYYRIKPTPTFRPWTADEVPLGSIMRTKGLEGRCIIIDTETSDDRSYWLNAREHSTDKGVTWLPCGVMEEGK